MKKLFDQTRGSTAHTTNMLSLARSFGLHDSEVVYAKAGTKLLNVKGIYDNKTSTFWLLPELIGSEIFTFSAPVLTTDKETLDLTEHNLKFGNYHILYNVTFSKGFTLTDKTQVVSFEKSLYRWNGELNKVVPPNSTIASTGGEALNKWVNINTESGGTNTVYVDTAAHIKSGSFTEGTFVITSGFNSINDGGAAQYYVTNATATLLDVSINDTLTAKRITDGSIDIRTVGAVFGSDIGQLLADLQNESLVNVIVIPAGSYDCNTKINVKKNFLFKSGSQIINRSLRDDMFVFETDNIYFRSDKRGGGRIAVDSQLMGWDHNVALVLGKNNLRNLTIENVKLLPNYNERLGTSLRIRLDNVRDGTNNPIKRSNSICWCRFDGLSLEYGKYGLYIEAYEPTDDATYTEATNWMTACSFKNNIIMADYGITVKCVPKVAGQYPYYTQLGQLEFDSIQQWSATSKWAIQVDGGGMNHFKHFVWDYSYYGEQGQYLASIRGADGRDNILETNIKPKEIDLGNLSNVIMPKFQSQETNAIGLRRICRLTKRNGSFVVNTNPYSPQGVQSVEPFDSGFALKINYTPGSGNWHPYIFTQSLNQASGYKYQLVPFYNQSGVSTGAAYLYLIDMTTMAPIAISSLPDGVEFNVEIVCTNK
ncbi:tail spike protein [Enterobacter phage EcP1]|uniref:Tail spike protein n=1 Tax=Enterobacter phage EcP1 TaxID=942016 RepID=E9NII8_9CAUD|nr:tail spike protein [Enterobacter phage EcP1]ADU79214.1 tail spike protein [Enterobacter phage EcP1]